MEDPKAEKVTNALSPPPTEQLTDAKQPPNPAVLEVEDAAGISPQEEPPVRSPVVEVQFHSPKPTEDEETDALEPAASTAELHSPSSSEGEQAPILETTQTAEEAHRVSHAEEDEVLASEISSVGVEHNAPVLLDGDEASVPEHNAPMPPEDREASSGPTQGGFEPDDGTVKEEVGPDPAREIDSDEFAGNEIEMSGDQAEDAGDVVEDGTVKEEVGHDPAREIDSDEFPGNEIEMSGDQVEDAGDVAEDDTVKEEVGPDPACEIGSDEFAGNEIEMSGDQVEDAGDVAEDDTAKEEVGPDPAREIDSDEFAGNEIEMSGDQVEDAGDVAEDAVESAGEDVEAACSGDVISENEYPVGIDVKRRGGRRRKRGRPTSKMQGTRFPSQRKEEEEVCFICFDGGDLVVCDRRGCPKVYHPSCVNREESYFQSKGQWTCGWHICSKCQKSSSYMCYTCTYSLCKVCVNEAEFTCIRGKKGFCPSCMSTILLMETSDNAKEKKDGVDFNDRSCWEYLFKDYWLELKGKLSMNLDELTKARTASKVCALDIGNEESSDDGQGASSDRSSACHDESISSKKKLKLTRSTAFDISRKEVQIEGMSPPEDIPSRKRMKKYSRNDTVDSVIKEEKIEVSTVHQDNSLMVKAKKRSRKAANEEGIANDTESEVSGRKNNSSGKKLKRRSRRAAEENLLGDANKELTTVAEDTDWASKELLEFVSHVKNGDKSILSQYDVQELLLDYIKVKKLRDPRKRSQIICDAMLLPLFGKSHVGHFEMLKLVESHFLIKVSSPASDENQGRDTDPTQMGAEVCNDMITDKRIIQKRLENERQVNFYDYVAIDVHNINLMYLRRSLMEDLVDDMSTFSEKVIGSFVRIRVTASSQRQEVYRLVQVVGCGKAPEAYKTGKRTTDVMLEIINLDKKEVITIDIISNQEFTEEECKRLRQSIKFGFISRLTVGEVQEKARVLQAVRVSDHLESEKLRLTHLRDRASEKGRKKEHRECVEKLQLLSTPEEQMKRLNEVPEVHTDPKMDPSYESPDDDGDGDEIKGNPGKPIQSTIKGRELISSRKEGIYNWNGVPKSSNNVIVSGRARHSDDSQSIDQHAVAARASEFPSQRKDIELKSNIETQKIQAKSSDVEALLDNKEPSRESADQPEPKLEPLPSKVVPPSNAGETEKLWHYKDPSGKIQGPFSMLQLRKWSKHFPSNLGIWRRCEKQEDSILLTDALAGNFQKDLPEWVPGDVKPTQLTKTSETTSVMNSAHLSSPSPSIISSSKMQGTATSLPLYREQGKHSTSDAVGVPTRQSSLGPHLASQNTPQNDKAVSNATCTDLIANLDNKQSTGSNDFSKISGYEQVVINGVNSESTQQASYQSIGMHNRPAVISSEIDMSKKLLEQHGTTPGRNIQSINGNNVQPRSDVIGEVSPLKGHAIQKHDLAAALNSDRYSNHGVPTTEDKLNDHSTSSTESNTVPEISTCDPTRTRFQNGGSLDVKPTAEFNALESVSPQRSDASTFPKPGPETPQSVHANSLAQNSGTSFAASAHSVNAFDQAQSQSGHPSHLVPQTVGPCNWNLPTDTKSGEQSAPSLNSTTMLSGASVGVSTSVNCQNTLIVSSDGSKQFSSPQLNNSTSTVTFQPSNMSWGTGTPEANNPGWQVPNQYQNFSNVAAAVGNLLCSTGVQGGLGNTNLGWGMMPQGNMNMPWGVAPNVNIAWGQGLPLPPQGNTSSNFVWGTPQGNTVPNDGCRPPAQGNVVAPYPIWNAPPVQGGSNQNPVWAAAPVVANMNQNAWGMPNQGNTGAINTPGVAHENKTSAWDPSKENPCSSSMQKEKFGDRNFGSRNGGFRGTGSGYDSGRQSRNWMPTGNADGSDRPPKYIGICKYFETGNCKKGASCNFIHT